MTSLAFLICAVIVGVTATLVFDLWSVLLQRTIGTPAPDWGLLGRWIGNFGSGTFVHANIRLAPHVRHERVLGWIAHYLVGTAFAALLLLAAGDGWARHPTLLPALIAGLATLACIWFILMPAFGHGVAAAHSPVATRIRLVNIASHIVLGGGFYLGARLAVPVLTALGGATTG